MATIDFSTFPDGDPAGFTDFPGAGAMWIVSGAMMVTSGGVPDPLYFGKNKYDTPDDDNVNVFEVEVSMYDVSDVLVLRYACAADESTYLSVGVGADGTYSGGYELGSAGASGTWPYPGHGVHFTVKAESTGGAGGYIWTINGGTPISGTQYARSGTYSSLLIAGGTKIHKWGYPTGLEAPPTGPKYTELEWNLKLQAPAINADVYEFRVQAGSTPLATYAVTPQLTASVAGGEVSLVVANGAHTVVSDSPTLYPVPDLVVSSGVHAHAADNVTLNYIVLAPAAAAHAHAAQNVALDVVLVPQAATHAHIADNVTLNYVVLAPANTTHAHTSDNVVLSTVTSTTLVVSDCLHTQVAGMPGVATQHVWPDTTPTPVPNAPYTLGIWLTATGATDLQGIRIWNPGLGSPTVGSRSAWLWSMDGNTGANPVLQKTIDLPETMPAGWSDWMFDAPVAAATNTWWCLAYYTDGSAQSDYGTATFGSGIPPSGPITIDSTRYGAGTSFPDGSGAYTYYGVDVLYGGAGGGVTDIILIEVPTPATNLVVADATHAHTADNVAVEIPLLVQGATHLHTAANVAPLGVDMVVQGAAHVHVAETPTLQMQGDLAIQSGVHQHSAANVDLTQLHVLTVDSAAHAHAAEATVLYPVPDLVVASAVHAHTAANVALGVDLVVQSAFNAVTSPNVDLVVDLAGLNASHAHSAANVVLYPVPDLLVASAIHAHTAVSPVLVVEPATQSAAHGVTSDNVLITPGLLVDNTLHLIESPEVSLSGAVVLSVQAGLHDHIADNVAPLGVSIVVQSAGHTHVADNVTPLGVSLAVQSATHAHSTDNVIITPALLVDFAIHLPTASTVALDVVLVVQSAAHVVISDNATIVQAFSLTVADAGHAHSADSVTLTQLHVLVVDAGVHAHTADHLPPFTGELTLTIAAGVHVVSSPNVALTQDHYLALDSGVHAHTASTIALTGVAFLIIQGARHLITSEEVDMRGAVVLNDALAVFLGEIAVSRVYAGSVLVWP